MPRSLKRPKPSPSSLTSSQHLRIRQAICKLQAYLTCSACQNLVSDPNRKPPLLLDCRHILCPSCVQTTIDKKKCTVCQRYTEQQKVLKDVEPIAEAVHQLVQFRQALDAELPISCPVQVRVREAKKVVARVRVKEPKKVSVKLRVRESLEDGDTEEGNAGEGVKENDLREGEQPLEDVEDVYAAAEREQELIDTQGHLQQEEENGNGSEAGHDGNVRLKRGSEREQLSELEQAQKEVEEQRDEIEDIATPQNGNQDDDESPVRCRVRLRDSATVKISAESSVQQAASRKDNVRKPVVSAQAELNLRREVSVPVTSPTVLDVTSPHLSREKSPFLSELDNESTSNSRSSAENVLQHAQNTSLGQGSPNRTKSGPFYVCIDRLSKDEQELELAEEIATRFGWEMCSDFRQCEQPSCIVTELCEMEIVNRSMVVHEALARRIPIVGLSWLIQCFKAGKRLDTQSFEAATGHRREGKGVFNSIVASFDKEFEASEKTLTRKAGEDIRRVMRAGGAIVVDSENLAGAVDRNSDIRLHVHVICDFGKRDQAGPEVSEEQMTALQSLVPFISTRVVNMRWISDCIFSGNCPPSQGEKSESGSGFSSYSAEDGELSTTSK